MAIVGATGAGKSSIAGLIARAYGGYEGSVRLNGEEITSFDADRIGAMVSIVHQNDSASALHGETTSRCGIAVGSD